MQRNILFRSPSLEIISHGNGWAYELKNKELNESIWVQDQDAADLRSTIEAYEQCNPNMPYDEIYDIIWDSYATS